MWLSDTNRAEVQSGLENQSIGREKKPRYQSGCFWGDVDRDGLQPSAALLYSTVTSQDLAALSQVLVRRISSLAVSRVFRGFDGRRCLRRGVVLFQPASIPLGGNQTALLLVNAQDLI